MTTVPILPDLERRTTYSPVASAGPFDVGFDIWGDGTDYDAWVRVFLDGLELLPATEWVLDSPSGPVSLLARPIRNARVTLATAATGQLVIVGQMRPRRTVQLTEGRGVSADDYNLLATRLMASNRETYDRLGRAEDQIATQIADPTVAPNAIRVDVVQDFVVSQKQRAKANMGLPVEVVTIEMFGGITAEGAGYDFDCSPAMEAATAYLASIGQGTIIYSRGTYCHSRTVAVEHSNIRHVGSGGNVNQNVGTVFAEAGTIFKWIGAAGGTMWSLRTPNDPAAQTSSGLALTGAVLNGNGLADVGVQVKSVKNGEMSDILVTGVRSKAYSFECYVSHTEIADDGNVQGMKLRNLTARLNDSVAEKNAHGFVFDGSSNANFSYNSEIYGLLAIVQDGTAFKGIHADNNIFHQLRGYAAGTGLAYDIYGYDAGGKFCDFNRFIDCYWEPGKLMLRGTNHGFVSAPIHNEFITFDAANGATAPSGAQVGTGAIFRGWSDQAAFIGYGAAGFTLGDSEGAVVTSRARRRATTSAQIVNGSDDHATLENLDGSVIWQVRLDGQDFSIRREAGSGKISLPATTFSGAVTLPGNPSGALDAAPKQYVDGIVDAVDGWQVKSWNFDCSANPNYPAASAGWAYLVTVAGKIGGASGKTVEVGDFVVCTTDGTASGNEAAVGTKWTVLQANLVGALVASNNLSDLSNAATARTNLGLAAVAASGSASDLGTGTLPAACLPNPAAGTLGGVKSLAAAAQKFMTSIGTDGTPAAAQPDVSDLSLTAGTWVPTFTASGGGAPTTIGGSFNYFKIGKFHLVWGKIVLTNIGTLTGRLRMSLPNAASAAADSMLNIGEYVSTGFQGQGTIQSGNGYAEITQNNSSAFLTNGQTMAFFGGFMAT